MNGHDFRFADTTLTALSSGALWWAENRVLTVSDLHLGKAERAARRGGPMLPPYEVQDTLTRLDRDVQQTRAKTIICLGDSFDDLAAADNLSEEARLWITRLQAGRRWIWIEGNHDAGPTALGGTHLAELTLSPLTFRHIARAEARAEISGHYHPKATLHAKGRAITRSCFLYDKTRVILPAYGTYTGGLHSTAEALSRLMLPNAMAILTGPNPARVPMPRRQENRDSTAS
ncbi:MAG: ligase-associated DNA damage response endonuclease PdeM [Paracoccaceae bacterium]